MKPPVEAPASRARRPVTAIGKRSSAASSLRPPRPTKGDGGPEQDDRLVRGDEARRLVGRGAGDEDGAGGDGRLGLLPGVDEAPSHELGVEPAAGPAGQLAAFLAAESLASATFLLVGLLGLGLGGLARRLDAGEAGRGHLGGGVAGRAPPCRPASRARWPSCRPAR